MTAAEPDSPAALIALFDAYRGSVIDLDTGQTTDATALQRMRDQLIAGLRKLGVSSADRILLAVPNGPQFLPALIATLQLGATPILVHFASTPAELKKDIGTWQAQWIATLPTSTLPDIWHWKDCAWLAAAATGQARPAGLPGVPLHPTSGTTAMPKLAARPTRTAIQEAEHYAAAMTIGADDRIMCATPMSHAYACGMGVIVPLVSQAHVLTMRNFNPRTAVRALSAGEASIMAAAPAMLRLMIRAQLGAMPGLRLMLTAGAPISSAAMAEFAAATGRMPCPLLGTTESGGIAVAVDSPRAGAVGPPLAGVSTRIVDHGLVGLPDIGRLQVRSESMMAGYWTDQGLDRSAITDGWFATGDLARIAEDGQLELFGRQAEAINVSGYKVLPSEVEEVLADLPQIREVKVYAAERRDDDHMVAAAIVLHEPLDRSAILSHCATRLAAFKCPTRIEFMDSLPRNRAGKIDTRALPLAVNPMQRLIGARSTRKET